MNTRPILFSAPMILALLAGRKTQTRRLLKPQPSGVVSGGPRLFRVNCEDADLDYPLKTPYALGDLLWVRERCATWEGRVSDVVYRADETERGWSDLSHDARHGAPWKLRPSIHMPRWASRLTLRVTDVRVQRLQEISDRDALAEGVDCAVNPVAGQDVCIDGEFWPGGPSRMFRSLWDSLNADRAPWADNPWVAAYTFEVHQCNVDQMEDAA